jgi:hypothetical protein
MTCVECGTEGTYWLCSNACAMAYSQKRKGVQCAICSFNPKTKQIGRNDTNEICTDCRRRPENQGWVEARNEDADPFIETRLAEMARLREQQDDPLPPISELTRRVVQLVIEGERVPYTYRDRKGVSHGVRYRWRAYTVRRLAKKLSCPRMTIQRIIDSIEK